jgi:hypothetical protein
MHLYIFVMRMLMYQEQGLNFTTHYQPSEGRRHRLDEFARCASGIMTGENMVKKESARKGITSIDMTMNRS